jgi:hypothetical protein
MKSVSKIILLLAYVGLLASPGIAQTNTVVIVDEFGNGTVAGALIPSVPAGPLGLQYNLPYVVFPGTVVMQDNNPIDGTQTSDIIVFTNTMLFFASDGRDGLDAPADVPSFLPIDTSAPTITITELGPEGNNRAQYTPGPGMPGYSSLNPTYTFISDVPEPSAALLFSLGLLALRSRHMRRWRR